MSYTEVDVNVAEVAAKNAIKSVEDRRNQLKENRINSIINSRFLFWIKTREGALNWMKNIDDWDEDYHLCGWGKEMDALGILSLCRASTTGKIMITSDDASLITEYGGRNNGIS